MDPAPARPALEVEECPTACTEIPPGKQEPAVSLEWLGPTGIRLGQPVTYQIVARNVSTGPVQRVVVRHRVPTGVAVVGTDPKAIAEGETLAWNLGTLQPGQEKCIDIELVPQTRSAINCHATVTFTGASCLSVQVTEPKLAVKATAPERALMGDSVTVNVTVSNTGDGVAERVKVKAVLPDGLEHARGRVVEADLGSLAAQETRTLQLVCAARAAGAHKCDVIATAEGNLTARDAGAVEVILPRIEVAVTGPKLRYLDRAATYVVRVVNPGSAAASNVAVAAEVPAGFKFTAATAGGRHDFSNRTVSWFVGDLGPGEAREVTYDAVAIAPGEQRHRAVATASRGLRAEAESVTRVEGLSALLMELVDLDDPVEVGAETAYEIRVTNTGSKTETNLELVCTLPDRMELRGAKCSAGGKHRVEGREVVFEPLPRLAPRADVIYRVTVRGTGPGDLRFRARIRADGLTAPVLREESTKVYGDDGPVR